jgi:histidinol-phosphatase (PHP family)
MEFVADYYNLVSDVYNKTKCNIVGHFDLITKFNGSGELFNEQSEKYISLAKESAKVVANQNTFIEVNTGAIARGYKNTFYPAENLLSVLASSGKPFVLSSDAHKLEHLNFGLNEAKEKLDKLGYKSITALSEIL